MGELSVEVLNHLLVCELTPAEIESILADLKLPSDGGL